MPKYVVGLLDWTACERNTLVGFATIRIRELRPVVHDVALHQREAAARPSCPAKPLLKDGGRFPWIVESALRNRHKQFVVDGEAVLFGVDRISDFNGLHSRRHDEEVQFYAFDVLALDGEDLRDLPLSLRQDKSGAPAARPAGRHRRHVVRARRDRSRPVSRRLQFGAGGHGVEVRAWCRSGAIDRTAPVTFHTIAWSSFAPPKCRMSLGQSQARR
jgi:hypothetical protein